MTRGKAETLNRIFDFVRYGNGAFYTRAEIARGVGLKKSPYLIQLLDQLVTDGHLFAAQDTAKNGTVMFLYTAGTMAEPHDMVD